MRWRRSSIASIAPSTRSKASRAACASARRPARRQRRLLDADTPAEQREVEGSEDERQSPGAEDERQQRDLRGDDGIVRMPHEAVGPTADERRLRQRDDAGRPELAERQDDPQTERLQSPEQRKRQRPQRRIAVHAEIKRRKPSG